MGKSKPFFLLEDGETKKGKERLTSYQNVAWRYSKELIPFWKWSSSLLRIMEELQERSEIDEQQAIIHLAFGWMLRGEIDEAIRWATKELKKFEYPLLNGGGLRLYYYKNHIEGFVLCEFAQLCYPSEEILDKIHSALKRVEKEEKKEKVRARLAGSYAKRGDVQKGFQILEKEISMERYQNIAQGEIAITLGKNGDVKRAKNMIEDLLGSANMEEVPAKVVCVLNEELIEEFGPRYYINLLVKTPYLVPCEVLVRVEEKLRKKDKTEEADELVKEVKENPQVDCFLEN